MSARDHELDSFKRNIDLIEFARKTGYELRPRESADDGLTLLEHPNRDRVVVARSPEGGWIYASANRYAPRGPDETPAEADRRLRDAIARTKDKGTIVEFVQARDCTARTQTVTVECARERLRDYVRERVPLDHHGPLPLPIDVLERPRSPLENSGRAGRPPPPGDRSPEGRPSDPRKEQLTQDLVELQRSLTAGPMALVGRTKEVAEARVLAGCSGFLVFDKQRGTSLTASPVPAHVAAEVALSTERRLEPHRLGAEPPGRSSALARGRDPDSPAFREPHAQTLARRNAATPVLVVTQSVAQALLYYEQQGKRSHHTDATAAYLTVGAERTRGAGWDLHGVDKAMAAMPAGGTVVAALPGPPAGDRLAHDLRVLAARHPQITFQRYTLHVDRDKAVSEPDRDASHRTLPPRALGPSRDR